MVLVSLSVSWSSSHSTRSRALVWRSESRQCSHSWSRLLFGILVLGISDSQHQALIPSSDRSSEYPSWCTIWIHRSSSRCRRWSLHLSHFSSHRYSDLCSHLERCISSISMSATRTFSLILGDSGTSIRRHGSRRLSSDRVCSWALLMAPTTGRSESVSLCWFWSRSSRRCTISLVSSMALRRSHIGSSSWSQSHSVSGRWSGGSGSSWLSVKKSVRTSSPTPRRRSHLSWLRRRSKQHHISISQSRRLISCHRAWLVLWHMNMAKTDSKAERSSRSSSPGCSRSQYLPSSLVLYSGHYRQYSWNKTMEKQNNLNSITKITIEKNGEWVLAALVREAKRYGVLFTRWELDKLGKQVCVSITDTSRSQKSNDQCIVQVGQVIQLPTSERIKTPTEIVDRSWLINWAGLIQKIDENWKKSYQYTTTSGTQTFPKG